MFKEAIQAMRDGDHAAADAAADTALAENPQDVDALYIKGLVRLGLGEHDAARTAFEAAVELAPERADIHMALVSLSVSAGRLDEAERASTAATKGDPNHLPAYVALANIHMAKGDLEEAERFVNLAARVAEDHPQTLLAKGQLAHMRGDNDAALVALNKAVSLAPEDEAALTALGLVYLAGGHAAFAEQALRKAVSLEPESQRSHWALVSALRRQGRAGEALEEMDRAAGGRRDGWVLAQRSTLALELGRDDEAVKDSMDLLRIAALHPKVLNTVVAGALMRGRAEVAERVVEGMLEQQPGHEDLWRHRVRIAGERRQPIGPVVERWLAAAPGSGEALQLQAMWLESQGELDAAEAAADRALETGARLDAAGMVKLRAELRRDPDAACERAEGMLAGSESAPYRREVLRLKGLASEAAGRPEDAVKEWTRMLGEAIPGMGVPRAEPFDAVPGQAPTRSEERVRPTLLWGAPGSDVPQLVRWIRSAGAWSVCDDRFGGRPRIDGFEPRSPGSERSARGWTTWHEALQAAGHDPAAVIDWLPHWDPATDRDLAAPMLVAAVRDPRDMLLNWWVFGGFPSYRFPGADEAAQWLEQALGALVQRRRDAPGDTILVRMDGERSGAGFAALEKWAKAGPSGAAADAAPSPSDWSVTGFPAGTWQRYQEALEAPFARLAPVARELGY